MSRFESCQAHLIKVFYKGCRKITTFCKGGFCGGIYISQYATHTRDITDCFLIFFGVRLWYKNGDHHKKTTLDVHSGVVKEQRSQSEGGQVNRTVNLDRLLIAWHKVLFGVQIHVVWIGQFI